jgi:hypothetical protein
MRRYARLAGLLPVVPLVAAAGDFDGSRPLICAAQEAWSCVSGKACASATPQKIGAPVFVRVDFERRTMVGPYSTTPIRAMERGDRQLLLQGIELGMVWSMALDQESGQMSASLLDRERGFVLFGACTPL